MGDDGAEVRLRRHEYEAVKEDDDPTVAPDSEL